MRLLGIALFTLLVLGLLQYAFTKSELSAKMFAAQQETRVLHDFATSPLPKSCAPVGKGTVHMFPVRASDTWSSLSSAPGYHRATFDLPRDVKVRVGTLVLDVAAQLQVDGVARMRVNVNGVRRGDVILQGGATTHQVRIDLTASDLTQSELVVSLSAQGRFPKAMCEPEWDGGIVVRIEPSSHIELITEGPLISLEDRLRVTGNPVQMVWPDTAKTTDLTRLLRFAADRRLRGTETEFVTIDNSCPVAVNLSELDLSYADQVVALAPLKRFEQWPMAVAQDPNLGSAKFFEKSNTWRIPYSLRDTPDSQLPTRFDLAMTLLGMLEGERWLLSVTLNGRSVHSEEIAGEARAIKRRIDLPAHIQGFNNQIEITLVSADEHEDQEYCGEGVPVMAQLDEDTLLQGGVALKNVLAADFAAALPARLGLRVSRDLNGTEATAAVDFLTEAFGDQVRWTPVDRIDQDAEGVVDVIWRASLAGATAEHLLQPDRDLWLVWPRAEAERQEAPFGVLRVKKAEDIAHFPIMEGTRIAALVALPSSPNRQSPSVPPATDALPLYSGDKAIMGDDGVTLSALPTKTRRPIHRGARDTLHAATVVPPAVDQAPILQSRPSVAPKDQRLALQLQGIEMPLGQDRAAASVDAETAATPPLRSPIFSLDAEALLPPLPPKTAPEVAPRRAAPIEAQAPKATQPESASEVEARAPQTADDSDTTAANSQIKGVSLATVAPQPAAPLVGAMPAPMPATSAAVPQSGQAEAPGIPAAPNPQRALGTLSAPRPEVAPQAPLHPAFMPALGSAEKAAALATQPIEILPMNKAPLSTAPAQQPVDLEAQSRSVLSVIAGGQTTGDAMPNPAPVPPLQNREKGAAALLTLQAPR